MHEMGIAGSILEAVEEELRRHPGFRASKVGLRIGEFAGVDPESLQFCFEAMAQASGTIFEIKWCTAGNGHRGDELDFSYLQLEEASNLAENVS